MENYFKLTEVINHGAFAISTECPVCGHSGNFQNITENKSNKQYIFSLRKCPNPKCHALVFFASKNDQSKIVTFPPRKISFDKSNIPKAIINVFDEVLTCHANQAYVAAAIMIRRTLEEICKNKGAEGNDLKKRIVALGSKIVIPKQLLEGMNELRLLGNNAAHVEARVFYEISENEITVAIEFTKKILEATYQYDALLESLKSLKQ